MSTVTQLTAVPAELLAGAQALPQPKPLEKDPKKASLIGKVADADQRLTIREGLDAGAFVYAVVDRASGKVMVQIPREDVDALAQRPDYSAGQVVDTKV
jgi:hypothetical protein